MRSRLSDHAEARDCVSVRCIWFLSSLLTPTLPLKGEGISERGEGILKRRGIRRMLALDEHGYEVGCGAVERLVCLGAVAEGDAGLGAPLGIEFEGGADGVLRVERR